MASIASPHFYRKFPLETISANVDGLKKLLEKYKNKKTKILYFSSSEIYGIRLGSKYPLKRLIGAMYPLQDLALAMMNLKDFVKLYVITTVKNLKYA